MARPSLQVDPASVRPRVAARGFRPDVEGLRAVAVVLVVLNHVWGKPTGGFVGVDVFYVISGFLITGLLLREFERTGSISFAGFYARRIKRILPAAVLVLVLTTVVAYLIWYRSRSDQTLADSLSALLFVSNWHFIRLGTDYLQAAGPISPVQHYWSLAVEEQFYVLWPPLVLLVLWLCARRGLDARRRRTALTVTLGTLSVLSFAWACWRTHSKPAFAYFDSVSRAWELGVGAMLAIAAVSITGSLTDQAAGGRSGTHRRAGLSTTTASLVVAAGIVVLIVSAIVITPSWPFPGPWAVLPVVAAGAIVFAGGRSLPWATWLLTNPISRYIGRISYSLYLWHFPVVIFAQSVHPHGGLLFDLALVAVMLALSALSYAFVEEPVRRSRWLKGAAAGGRRRQFLIPVGVGAVIVVLAVAQYKGPASLSDGPRLTAALGFGEPTTTAPAPPFGSAALLQADLTAAAGATSWPALTPSLNAVSDADEAPAMSTTAGCRNDVATTTVHYCDSGGPPGAEHPKTAVVIGDSVAASWMPAVQAALVPDGYRVRGLMFANCPISTAHALPRVYTATFLHQCDNRRAEMITWAIAAHPDLIVVSNAGGYLDTLASGAKGPAAQQEWQTGVAAALQPLAGHRHLVLLSNPPVGGEIPGCATKLTSPAACRSDIAATYGEKATAERAAAVATGGTLIDTADWFCTTAGQCPAFAGSTLMRIDDTHLTDRYATALAPLMRAALVPEAQ